MSRELEIEVDSASVERVRADLAAVPLFTEDRPLRGGVGRADWRLCGRLSELVASGRLAGERGEAALVATFGGLQVPLLLVLGAGSRADFDLQRFADHTQEAVSRAIGLRAGILALAFPDAAVDGAAHERRVAALVRAAATAVAEATPPVELRIKLLVPREDLTRASELLRRAQRAGVPDAVALRLPAPRTRQAASGRAGVGAPSGGPHLVK